MRRGFLLRGLLLWASVLGGGRGSRAAEAPATVVTAHLEVQAPAICATRDELAARVEARSQHVQFVDEAAGVIGLRAEIAPGPNGSVVGQLAIVDPNGRRSSRRLTAPTCAEAIDALALIIVITLDPTYAPPPAAESDRGPVAPNPTARAVPESAAGERRPDSGPTAGRTAGGLVGEGGRAGAYPNRAPPTEPPPTEGPSPRSAVGRLGIGAAAELVSGPAPRILPGAALRVFAALDRASIWSPALRLTVGHAWQNGIDEPGGTAAFALDTIALDVCPTRLHVAVVDLRGCAAGTFGRLSATGSNTYSPASQARPFLTLGGSAILDAAIGRHLDLSAAIGVADALIRDTFEFSPQAFYRVSAMTLTVDLGFTLRFP